MSMGTFSRRNFVKSAGAAGIALTVSIPVTGAALADDAPVSEIAADKRTHADYDWESKVTEELS